jgi:hypothetical protein
MAMAGLRPAFCFLADASSQSIYPRHCEAQRAEAIQRKAKIPDCFRRRPSGYGGHVASLAMT